MSDNISIKTAKEIEAYLKQEKKRFESIQKEPKVLILGSSDSGKSTLLKQLKIIYSDGFTNDEKNYAKKLIFSNIITVCAILLEIHTTSYQNLRDFINTLASREESFVVDVIPEVLIGLITDLWNNIESQEHLANLIYPIPDSTSHFINRLPDLIKPDCLPTQEDILLLRTVTQSVSETIFKIQMGAHEAMAILTLHVFDVSGLMHHRKHWISFFEYVDLIIFVMALNSYDQFLIEDPTINRMQDALVLFEEIVNHPLLQSPSIALFMNKKDAFAIKIAKTPIQKFFPDYQGFLIILTLGAENNINDGLLFFKKKFLKTNKMNRTLSVQPTCCTDTNLMKNIVTRVIGSITKRQLQSMGLYN
ncbi:guanine nucleotide binding protein, alpha subunit [Globomyces pollinis-pini]|nr:guanine nucleotide binding protein, alpha subunit [Globomyces pollinis-pini]